MTSVNKINEVISTLRGEPASTIESYSRVLRREGLLPETRRGGGATPIGSFHMATMLMAVMRGSPTRAAENAREVGELIVHDGGGLQAPILASQLAVMGWQENTSFAEAVASFIDRYADGTINDFTGGQPIEIKVQRYWPSASISWVPTGVMLEALVRSHTEVYGADAAARVLVLGVDGKAYHRMKISFESPLRYEQIVSYRDGDNERNEVAHRKYQEMAEEAKKYDVRGSEGITSKTLIALAKLLKP